VILKLLGGILPLFSLPLWSQNVQRPEIIGIATVSFYAHDPAASRVFYHEMLGFDEPFDLKNPDGSTSLDFFKVNDRQYIEVEPEKNAGTERLKYVAFEVRNAEAIRKYLSEHGVPTPDHVTAGRSGNLNLTIKDPQGVAIAFVQRLPASLTSRSHGKDMPQTRISSRIMHVGFVVTKLEEELKFYEDVLGFREFWRGSSNGQTLSWINLRLPDSQDYIELMLYGEAPAPDKQGSANHVCLEVPDAQASAGILAHRAGEIGYKRAIEVHTGKNGKRIINLFDPDGTRTEVMEPHTIDGNPAPSSTAPPPRSRL
jgi:lactoylglutathione lyase